MKKLIALLLALVMVFALAACTNTPDNKDDNKDSTGNSENTSSTGDTGNTDNTGSNEEAIEGAMSYAEYDAAALNSQVTVVTYVQATQSWWDNKITAYCQSKDGAYLAYEMACTQEDAAKLTPGTKIKITGTKAQWEGEVEITDATFEFVEGGDKFIAEPMNVMDLLNSDELIKHQNKKVQFLGLKVEKVEYKNGEPGDDIYLTLSNVGTNYNFCVERYLTDPDSDVYKEVATLCEGDIVDVEAFLYWYQGMNPHITKLNVAFCVNELPKG